MHSPLLNFCWRLHARLADERSKRESGTLASIRTPIVSLARHPRRKSNDEVQASRFKLSSALAQQTTESLDYISKYITVDISPKQIAATASVGRLFVIYSHQIEYP
jgi:hypothetical protein